MANQEKKPRRSAGKSNRSLFRRTVFLMVCLGVLCFIPLVRAPDQGKSVLRHLSLPANGLLHMNSSPLSRL